MTVLVSGGSKCGKSGYAESLFDGFRGEKIYLATMRPLGDEAEAAIGRHREARSGKGFFTLERFADIGGADIPGGAGVLLEDMGNLLANETFPNGSNCIDQILRGIEKIQRASGFLVIVTNNVCADGIAYPGETERYIRYLSEINRRIAERADCVVECVYGIPICRKKSTF